MFCVLCACFLGIVGEHSIRELRGIFAYRDEDVGDDVMLIVHADCVTRVMRRHIANSGGRTSSNSGRASSPPPAPLGTESNAATARRVASGLTSTGAMLTFDGDLIKVDGSSGKFVNFLSLSLCMVFLYTHNIY